MIIAEIRKHEARFPDVTITRRWREPTDEPVTARLLITGDDGRLLSATSFRRSSSDGLGPLTA